MRFNRSSSKGEHKQLTALQHSPMRKMQEKHCLDECPAAQQTGADQEQAVPEQTFLHNPGNRPDLFIYKKQSTTAELMNVGDLPLQLVLLAAAGPRQH